MSLIQCHAPALYRKNATGGNFLTQNSGLFWLGVSGFGCVAVFSLRDMRWKENMKRNRWIYAVWVGMVVFAGATALHADDWPQFRGPTGDGLAVATNLPLTWSPTQHVK